MLYFAVYDKLTIFCLILDCWSDERRHLNMLRLALGNYNDHSYDQYYHNYGISFTYM